MVPVDRSLFRMESTLLSSRLVLGSHGPQLRAVRKSSKADDSSSVLSRRVWDIPGLSAASELLRKPKSQSRMLRSAKATCSSY